MTQMPILQTPRLSIRPFVLDDLQAIYHLLDVELRDADLGTVEAHSLAARAEWLQWTVLNYRQLAQLYQPPYGERAVILRDRDTLIGACGLVPCLDAFELLPGWAAARPASTTWWNTPEVGLFYAISPAFQRHGYATEAAQALVDYTFQALRLKRLIATTTFENTASLGVMRKLGMHIIRNPHPDPAWFQVVGVLTNPL